MPRTAPRCGVSRRVRAVLRADRAFGLLVLLGLVSSAILIALLATLIPRIDLLVERGAEGPADVVAVVLLLLATLGIALGISSLLRQLHGTLVLIRSLLSRRVAPPERLSLAAAGLGLEGRIDAVEDARPFSFCYWFARPRICVSSGLVDRLAADELRAVLLHERYHLRHRDPLRIVVARYFAAGLYVVPVVDDLVTHFALEKEIDADEDAVAAMGDVRPLARALYALLRDADELSLGLLVPVGSLSATEARIDHLLEGTPLPVGISPAHVALSLGALAAASVLAAAPTAFVAPLSLLLAAAVSGGVQQVRVAVHR